MNVKKVFFLKKENFRCKFTKNGWIKWKINKNHIEIIKIWKLALKQKLSSIKKIYWNQTKKRW